MIRVIHHLDCTYCIHRMSHLQPVPKRKSYEIEKCALTDQHIPPPFDPNRICAHYVQTGCTCANCVPVTIQS